MFLEHIRRQASDPELLIRYQLFFSPQSPINLEALRDTGETFHEDLALRQLFNRCFVSLEEGQQSLVAPFAGWLIGPYLQFGKRTEIASATASAVERKSPTETPAEPRQEAHEVVVNLVSEARSLPAAGHLDEAASLLRDGEEKARRILEDEHGRALILGQLGLVQEAREDYASAAKLFQEALNVAQQVANRSDELSALFNLGRVQSESGDPNALETLETALRLCREIGDPLGQVTILQEIGALKVREGKLKDAVGFYEEALESCKGVGASTR